MTANSIPNSATSRAGLVEKAVKSWTGELIDLGGRNTLLYFRDLKQGTLDLGPASAANDVAVDALLASRPSRLSTLFDDASIGAAARRARTVRAKAAENFEERGIQTLFLAWGMATWTNARGTATPAAPILLRQAALVNRGGMGEDFDLSLPGEWEINPTLLHLLRTDYQIEIQADDLLERLDEDGDPPDPMPVYESLLKATGSAPGFQVRPRLVLGNFSYAKLPMVLDLESATDALVSSEIICAIAGDEGARATVRARHPNITLDEPDRVPPKDEFLVLDADASQSYAINAAVGGADIVIDGPPGTGKSQTIANLIATLSARGQRVLFVAEKRAAIEAVLDRLNRVGLGDLVLDLHEGVGSKRKLAADLLRALATVSSLPRPSMADVQETLVRRRYTLVGRVQAVHQRRVPWDVSIYQVQSRLLDIPATSASTYRLRGDALRRLDAESFRQARHDLDALMGMGGLAISAASSPWNSAYEAATITTPDVAQTALTTATTLAQHTLPGASARLNRAAAECGLVAADTLADWAQALELIRGVETTLSLFEPAIFDLPLDQLASALAAADHGAISRITDHDYRQARKAVLLRWRGAKPKPVDLHVAVVNAAHQAASWRRAATDGGQPRLPPDLAGAASAYFQLCAEVEALRAVTAVDDLVHQPIAQLQNRLQWLLSDTQTLGRLPDYCRLRANLSRAGLEPLIAEVRARNLTVDQALASLDHVWLTSILETVSLADPYIGSFDGEAHRRIVAEYQAADRSHIESAAVRVKRAVAENVTRTRDAFPKESDVVAHQAKLKRSHLPVRQLFQAAPNVLSALKPCWAMSPLMVAQLLPANRCFDVVIFDEASQVPPADAVGALMRAERAVVAGDPHQLPPTSFFMTSGGGEDDEEAEETFFSAASGTKNMESVLDAMGALLPPPKGTRTLGWHYRSKDERLIAFSNAQPELYQWALTTFPGIGGSDCIGHALVPFAPGRIGQESSVSDEVNVVVDLVAEHARSRPDESLGVIAMGIKHANRIEEALRRAKVDDPDLDDFLSGAASSQAAKEPFFVKNLERVQGDERDAICLSIGYGKNPEGRMLYRFGPLNYEGGERRLNVAITRARASMIVVSSFSAADMDPGHLRSAGAQMLGRYLAYAESKGSDLGRAARSKPELNAFERDVETQLTRNGIPLDPQHGSSGYWIDFAAKHPTYPGHMVLAIECDGATYHSSATARDRDRLRQEHLERLGWTFHRIWSQDWFYHREAEVARAVTAYREAVVAHDARMATQVEARPTGTPVPAAAPVTAGPAPRGRPCPVSGNRAAIDYYSRTELIGLIDWIESDTLLRTEQELLDEAVRILGFRRKGPKIVTAVTQAIRAAHGPRTGSRRP